jgi:hypothetical protein
MLGYSWVAEWQAFFQRLGSMESVCLVWPWYSNSESTSWCLPIQLTASGFNVGHYPWIHLVFQINEGSVPQYLLMLKAVFLSIFRSTLPHQNGNFINRRRFSALKLSRKFISTKYCHLFGSLRDLQTGVWTDDRIYCTLMRLLLTFHTSLYDTLCMSFVFHQLRLSSQ